MRVRRRLFIALGLLGCVLLTRGGASHLQRRGLFGSPWPLSQSRSSEMKTIATIRYVSGREEQFEIEMPGGTAAEDRLMAFSKDPNILLQTDAEIIIIPSTAIERITVPLPASWEGRDLPRVRKAKRIEEPE
jgi:hypothetical protein